jgi:hypothetical protein
MRRLLLSIGVIVAAACGGETGSNGSTASTGGNGNAAGSSATGGVATGTGGDSAVFGGDLPPDTVLGELSDAEYRAYCEQAAAFIVDQNQDALCRVVGVSQAAGDTATCLGLYSMCMALPPETLVTQVDQIDCTKPPTCEATAEQMNACVTGLGSAVPEAETDACSDLVSDPALPTFGLTNLPMECAPAMAACPGFLIGGGASGGAGGAGGASGG